MRKTWDSGQFEKIYIFSAFLYINKTLTSLINYLLNCLVLWFKNGSCRPFSLTWIHTPFPLGQCFHGDALQFSCHNFHITNHTWLIWHLDLFSWQWMWAKGNLNRLFDKPFLISTNYALYSTKRIWDTQTCSLLFFFIPFFQILT